jgi:DNA-binding response OmpR family regulator
MVEGELVLVVEDNHSIRTVVCEMLQGHGFLAAEAHAGWKALELAEKSPPDVLLLDWQLPDISGLDVLRALRAGGCQSPAILMTGYGSEELAMVALRLGVRNYLLKPFSKDELFNAVELALTETRLRRKNTLLVEQLAQATRRLGEHAQQVVLVKATLAKLTFLIAELKRRKRKNWTTRVEEALQYTQQMAEAIETLA